MSDQDITGEVAARMNRWVADLGRGATEIMAERDAKMRMQHGLTPQDFQTLAGRFYDQANPSFQTVSLVEGLHAVQEGLTAGQLDEREIMARLVMIAMQHAYLYQYDLYESTYEIWAQLLLDAETRGREAEAEINK